MMQSQRAREAVTLWHSRWLLSLDPLDLIVAGGIMGRPFYVRLSISCSIRQLSSRLVLSPFVWSAAGSSTADTL